MRALTDPEITTLKTHGCRAENWRALRVAEKFSPAKIFNVSFCGDCELGVFSERGGIENSTLRQCRVENGARVANTVAENYTIGENAKIHAVAALTHGGKSTHGANERITVLRETGGIEIIAHPDLTAPIAWLQAFASFSESRRQRWQKMTAENSAAGRGRIGANAEIIAGQIIRDTQVGDGAKIHGANFIDNSTVNGEIGAGAVVKNSLILRGGYVGDGCRLDRAFVGDGARLDDGFHADNSLFFANCDCRRGEADALFAAPFTVSHHQPTLLIAALTSFFNAGSGTNFSNHRYKLGARHFGALERGVKCGLHSGLTLPSRVGIFSTVIGEHRAAFDSSGFPFAQIREQEGESILLPGANLFGAGLERDEKKWRSRDCRFDKNSHLYHAAVWSPLVAEQIERALFLLKTNSSPIGLTIPAAYRQRAIERYENGLAFYYGKILLPHSPAALKRRLLAPASKPSRNRAIAADSEWLDVGGIIATRGQIAALLKKIDRAEINSYAECSAAISEIYRAFADDELRWTAARQIDRRNFAGSLKKIREAYARAQQFRETLLAKDAVKENGESMRMNYGVFAESARDKNFAFINGDK